MGEEIYEAFSLLFVVSFLTQVILDRNDGSFEINNQTIFMIQGNSPQDY